MKQDADGTDGFLCKIGTHLLFIRSAKLDEISKLRKGENLNKIGFKRLAVNHGTLLGLIQQGDLAKTYSLAPDFSFNEDSVEFVVPDTLYDEFNKLVVSTVEDKPSITLDEFLRLEWKPKSRVPAKKAGRPRAGRDPQSGKLINMDKVTITILTRWDEGKSIDEIRSELHPRTVTPTQRTTQRELIMRRLRKYRHLLKRPYNTK